MDVTYISLKRSDPGIHLQESGITSSFDCSKSVNLSVAIIIMCFIMYLKIYLTKVF